MSTERKPADSSWNALSSSTQPGGPGGWASVGPCFSPEAREVSGNEDGLLTGQLTDITLSALKQVLLLNEYNSKEPIIKTKIQFLSVTGIW